MVGNNSNYINPNKDALSITIKYGIFGLLWITASDQILLLIVNDISTYQTVQTYKGWAYVLLTMLLIYSLVYQHTLTNKVLLGKVKAAKERQDSILSSTGAGTWEWNVQTGETYFNAKWADIIGYEMFEISPVSIDTWMNFLHPEDVSKSEAALNKHFNGKSKYYECEARMQHKAGHWVWVFDKGQVQSWTDDGKPLWMFGIHLDISERKQMEEELFAAKEAAEQAQIAKAKFISNMSHEMRTPLNSVIGLAEVLEEELEETTNLEYIKIIKNNGENLLDIINTILELGNIDSGVIKPRYEDVKMWGLLTEVKTLFTVSANNKGLKILINSTIHNLEQFTIQTDKILLRQILINIVSNAVKFTDKGHINISIESHYDDFNKTNLAIIKIQDTGIGISEDAQSKIFETFEQVESGFTRSYGGCGLGLAISKELSMILNGRIELQSNLGEGSTFSVIIPYSDSE